MHFGFFFKSFDPLDASTGANSKMVTGFSMELLRNISKVSIEIIGEQFEI